MISRQLTAGCLLVLFLTACTGNSKSGEGKSILLLDFTKKLEEKTFILNDISGELRLVRLETSEECQLSYFGGYAGENYIVTQNNEKLLLFDRDGKLLDIIAVNGQGPGEFVQIDAMDIDDNEEYLLYHDRGRDFIYRYNLLKLEHENNIPFKDEGFLGGLIAFNDTSVAIFRSNFSAYSNIWFFQDLTGNIFSGKKRKTVEHPGSWSGMWPVFIKVSADEIMYQPSDVDTVYGIKNGLQYPAIVLDTEKPLSSGSIEEGYSVRLLYRNNNICIFSRNHYEKTQSANSASMRVDNIEYIICHRTGDELFIAEPMTIDYKGISFEPEYMSFYDNGSYTVQFQALQFRKMLEEGLQDTELDVINRKELSELLDRISEDDNPILFVGSI